MSRSSQRRKARYTAEAAIQMEYVANELLEGRDIGFSVVFL